MNQSNKKKNSPGKFTRWWQRLKQRAKRAHTYTLERHKELLRQQKYYEEDIPSEQGNRPQTERITLPTVIRILLSEFGEREYWRTQWQLLWRPGYAIADFLNGRRRRFLRPFQLLLGTTILLGLALYVVPAEIKTSPTFETLLSQELVKSSSSQDLSAKDIEVLHKMAYYGDAYRQWLEKHIALGLLAKSFLSFIFTWLLFRKSPRHGCPFIQDSAEKGKVNYNFAEILTANIFIVAQLQMVNVLWILATGWFVPYIDFRPYAYPFIIANIIAFIDYQQLFGRKWYDTLWRTFIAFFFTTS